MNSPIEEVFQPFESFHGFFLVVGAPGLGTNLKERPSTNLVAGGSCLPGVKSWNARWCGLSKYCWGDMSPSTRLVFWRVEARRSGTKPKSLSVLASSERLSCASLLLKRPSSQRICFGSGPWRSRACRAW